MKGWVGWPIADGLPTLVVTHKLQVERRTGKVRRPETDKEYSSEIFNRLRFDRIMAMSLWPRFFGPPCTLWRAFELAVRLHWRIIYAV